MLDFQVLFKVIERATFFGDREHVVNDLRCLASILAFRILLRLQAFRNDFGRPRDSERHSTRTVCMAKEVPIQRTRDPLPIPRSSDHLHSAGKDGSLSARAQSQCFM